MVRTDSSALSSFTSSLKVTLCSISQDTWKRVEQEAQLGFLLGAAASAQFRDTGREKQSYMSLFLGVMIQMRSCHMSVISP